ncbi:uncharacterized protein LOC135833270 [Planococcus citri]|uniref:uncharacterized protein LOC135833270 n=1 Tax=Planococcus citri TaxID=170843 RepID=UPI0031F99EC7
MDHHERLLSVHSFRTYFEFVIKKMNFVLMVLVSTSLVITVSVSYHVVEKTDFELMYDLRFVKECTNELNLELSLNTSNYNFTVADLKSIGIPKTLDEGCLLDCYHFKMGQIRKRKQPDFMEYRFIGQPPKSGIDLTNKTQSYIKKVAEAEADCGKFLTTMVIKECHLVFQHRYCVAKVLNGTRLQLLH